MVDKLISFIRDIYQTNEYIPLHAPQFRGNEKKYVAETIDSTFVSSVGKFVDDFENKIAKFTGSPRAVATVNGTAALSTALYMAGVGQGDLVITQALTFVATCNAIYHLGAKPVLIDIEPQAFGLCPVATQKWLSENARLDGDGHCVHKETAKKIKAIVPMHTFGHPVQLEELLQIAREWNLVLIEDAAESLGSYYKECHTGTFGNFGTLSFNGNKIITTGGGGMLLCANPDDGVRAKHLTTTAKKPHPYEFYHDEPGFNFRMPNLNAALGCAQMEELNSFLDSKRKIAKRYEDFFSNSDYIFVKEPAYARSNYWLNSVYCPSIEKRNELLAKTNSAGVMTRPVWQLMHRLPAFEGALRGELPNAEAAEAHLVSLPSSVV
ncbi:MAG: GDP-perosamine synthase [Turneriella sp.]|nr:GDP-perosamine synthase [Turneriella sp.]